MDIIQQQQVQFKRRESRVSLMLMATLTVLLCLGLIARVQATEYIFGTNVYPCDTNLTQGAYECRPMGEKTPIRTRAKFRYEDGSVQVHSVNATVRTFCDSEGLCSAMDNLTGQRRGDYMGEVLGNSGGVYLVPYGWYISVDAGGNPTVYQRGMGPAFNMTAYGEGFARDEDGNEMPVAYEWED